MNRPSRPSESVPLFEHLAQWGEVSICEAEELGVVPWVSLFEDAGALKAVRDKHDQRVAWYLAPEFVRLLEMDSHQAGRRLCFAVPAYREYLLGIVSEGLVEAARIGMIAELEGWTGSEFAALISELNDFLDTREAGSRLVDLSSVELGERLSLFPGRTDTFTAWDLFALGHSGSAKTLFEFALRRFAPLSAPLSSVDETPAVLRKLPLNRDDGFSLGDASLPQTWNTYRHGVISGVPVVSVQGERLFDEDRPLNEALIEHLRDSLVNHPFYSMVVQLAIASWRSPASNTPPVELFVPTEGALHEVSIRVGSQVAGRVSDLLGNLVRLQGYSPFGLVEGRIPSDVVTNLFLNLLELQILRRQDEQLVLHETYQSSLMAGRLRTVFRLGKPVQERMIEAIASHAVGGGPS